VIRSAMRRVSILIPFSACVGELARMGGLSESQRIIRLPPASWMIECAAPDRLVRISDDISGTSPAETARSAYPLSSYPIGGPWRAWMM